MTIFLVISELSDLNFIKYIPEFKLKFNGVTLLLAFTVVLYTFCPEILYTSSCISPKFNAIFILISPLETVGYTLTLLSVKLFSFTDKGTAVN